MAAPLPTLQVLAGFQNLDLNTSDGTFESGVAGWSPSGGTFAQSTVQAHTGTHSGLLTVTGTPSQAFVRPVSVTVTPGGRYDVTMWVFSDVASVAAAIDWFTSPGVGFISTTSVAYTVTIHAWTPITVSGVAPWNATGGRGGPTLPGSPATGTKLYVDDFLGPITGPGAFQDISASVRSLSVIRPVTRLQGPLWQYQAGTASVTLKNGDGRFDPDNLTGPYVSAATLQAVTLTALPGLAGQTWTAPANLFGATTDARCWGPGGFSGAGPAGGQGGGEYAEEPFLPAVASKAFTYQIGSGVNGFGTMPTTFGTVTAHAGSSTVGSAGGLGGTGSTNTIHFNGGTGGTGGTGSGTNGGGSGGSSAGPDSAGNTGSNGNNTAAVLGGLPVAGGGQGGAGGYFDNTSTPAVFATPGMFPGGGAGTPGTQGVSSQNADSGAPGGNGQIQVLYRAATGTSVSQIGPGVDIQVNAKFGAAGTPGGGLTTRVAAFLNEANISAADFNGANAIWTGFTGQALTATRVYEAPSTFTYTADMIQMVAAGVKMCIDFKPAFSPVSGTDLASLTTVLQTLTAAGAVCDISLWHEPFFAGLTAAQYVAMIQFYGPTVRQFYPLYACFSGSDTNPASGYYPGDAWVDGVSVDCYAFSGTSQITNAAALAPSKPFGIWEFGSSTGINNLTGDNTTFTATAGNWTGSGNCNTSRATSPVYGISAGSLQMSSIAAGTMSAASAAAANFATQMLAVTPGDEIVVSSFFRAHTLAQSCQVGCDFYTSGGVFVSTVLSADATATVTDSTSAWAGAFGTLTAPATAAWAREKLVVNSTGGVAEIHYGALAHLSNATAAGQTKAAATTFFQFVSSFMTARLAAGQSNADMLLFNSAVPGTNIVSVIDNPGDYRIGLWQQVYTALNGAQSGGYHLFTGTADGWTDAGINNPRYAETVLTATDGFEYLANVQLPLAPGLGTGEDSGARITRILNAAGWPAAARAITTGDSTQQGATYGSDALSLLQLTADTEAGEVYVNGAGNVVFRHRQAILEDTRSNTPQAVFGDQIGTFHTAGTELALALIGRADDNTTIANDIQITAANSLNLQEVQDLASQSVNGVRSYARTDLLLVSDQIALEYAAWILALSKNSEDRFDTVTVNPRRDPADLFPQALGREIGDRVQVWRTPPGVAARVTKDGFIRSIQHDIDASTHTWTTTWTLQNTAKYDQICLYDVGKYDVNTYGY